MKKRLLITFLVSVLILSMQWQLARADNYYGMANDYLQYGAGARSLAMGGAYVALADEASGPYWNPAALTQVEEHQFLSMYAPFFEQTNYNFLSYVHPLRRLGSIGISDVLLHSGGYKEVRLVEGIIGTNRSIFKNAIIISYANKVRERISLGASLKLIHERVMRYSGSGQGIDLGILYQPLDVLNIGLALQNVLQPKVTLRDDPDVYEINLKAGMALRTFSKRLTVTADINKLVDEKAYFCAGLEVSPWDKPTAPSLKRVDLRLGCNHLQTFTCGLGLKIKFFTVDYAFSSHDLGNLHKFALTFNWGNIYKASVNPILKTENTYGLEALTNELEFSTDIPSITVKKWTLEIKDADQEVVKTFSGETRPPEIIKWDVCDDMGRPVKKGDYIYEFSVVYKNDKQWVDQGEIKLQSFSLEEMPIELRVNGEELTEGSE
ncbi:MAG: PorV/PorQ family protein [bacterium]